MQQHLVDPACMLRLQLVSKWRDVGTLHMNVTDSLAKVCHGTHTSSESCLKQPYCWLHNHFDELGWSSSLIGSHECIVWKDRNILMSFNALNEWSLVLPMNCGKLSPVLYRHHKLGVGWKSRHSPSSRQSWVGLRSGNHSGRGSLVSVKCLVQWPVFVGYL